LPKENKICCPTCGIVGEEVGFDIGATDNNGFFEERQFLCENCERMYVLRIIMEDGKCSEKLLLHGKFKYPFSC